MASAGAPARIPVQGIALGRQAVAVHPVIAVHSGHQGQLKLLERDNVVGAGALTLQDLGVEATAAETILPSYLGRFRPPRLHGSRAA